MLPSFVISSHCLDLLTGFKTFRLDQELAIEKDEASFDPEKDIRNYDELARSLPVFCVSAHAYQKLAGRLEKDAVQINGFATLDDTEIPQLQEHAKKLTEGGRISTSLLFLSELNRLLNSMRLWAAASTRTAVSEKDQMIDEKVLRGCLMGLEKVINHTFFFHLSRILICCSRPFEKSLWTASLL